MEPSRASWGWRCVARGVGRASDCAIMTGMKTRRGAHTIYRLAYHFVWIPRYRRQVLTGEIAERLDELIRAVCAARDWEVEALSVQADHVHLFVSCPPADAPARVMNAIKSVTARELYAAFPRLRKSHWGGKLWADGYYVGSAGDHVTSDLIQRYIAYQGEEDSWQLTLF